MNWKRIIRDTAILAFLCGMFSLSTYVIGEIGDDGSPDEQSFSRPRIRGDQDLEDQDWLAAAEQFKKLTEQDPYNGYAWYRQSTAYLRLRYEAKMELQQIRNVPGKEQKTKEITAAVWEYENLAVEYLQKAREYPQHRRNSLYFLAIVDADRGKLHSALEYLQEFVESGYSLYDGLASVEQYGRGGKAMTYRDAEISTSTRLHQFPLFWELVDQEYLIRLERNPMEEFPRRRHRGH